ncbi:uncharacterized protein CDV56_102378 [Aspergillus thermomutatus]|uniref:Uncharacterized protein n=1 Tax=Aspergillus thermomutatus TaxID=41047 RepID=A0A397GKL4_ASPTH|nr:uncharacterized protein CDV56_102378 [Aspergillus thermomutatus]RHZ51077.1 hypothetical protein CDV56_102378 [Aspergillus thermomutatus]
MHRILSVVSLSACLLASTAVASTTSSTFDLGRFNPQDIITRDVAVIGGGSAGTYSAISLKDKGKSVIVIEKKDRIGGHTETYIDPATGTTIDMGVMIFHNITIVKHYFRRFDIPLANAPGFFQLLRNYDFRTGKEITLSFTPSAAEVAAALTTYAAQLSKYPGLNDGVFLPNPVPEELYMPFGDFVQKYGPMGCIGLNSGYLPRFLHAAWSSSSGSRQSSYAAPLPDNTSIHLSQAVSDSQLSGKQQGYLVYVYPSRLPFVVPFPTTAASPQYIANA